MEELEKRVARLEQEMNLMKKAKEEEPLILKTSKSQGTTLEKEEEIPKREQVEEPQRKISKTIDWEKEIGQKWLPRVFLFVLLLGIVWAFSAGVQNGWITELMILIIGYIVGIGMLFLGEKQIKENRRPLGLVLAGGSVMVFILSTFAMHVLYGYIGIWLAFALNIVWIAIGFYLSHKHRTQSLAVVMSIGGFLLPFLVDGSGQDLEWLFYGYEFFVYIGFLLYAYSKRYIVLHYVSFLFLHPLLLTQEHGYLIATAQYIVVLTLFLAVESVKRHHYYSTLLTSFTLTCFWLTGYFGLEDAKWFILLLVVGNGLLTCVNWKKEPLKRDVLLAITTFGAMVVTFMYFPEGEGLTGLLLGFQGIVAIYLGKRLDGNVQNVLGWIVFGLAGIATYNETITHVVSIAMLAHVVWIGAFYLLYKFSYTKYYHFVLAVRLFAEFIFVIKLAQMLGGRGNEMAEAVAISLMWLGYALVYLFVGLYKNKKVFKVFGLVMMFAVLLKITLVDLTVLSVSLRAVVFIVLGIAGVGVSRIFYKKE